MRGNLPSASNVEGRSASPKPAPNRAEQNAVEPLAKTLGQSKVAASTKRQIEPDPVTLPPEKVPSLSRNALRLNVGVDFGTSSTKVCIRPTLGDAPDVKTYPVTFDAQSSDPLFGPSTIGCKDGLLYFGSIAEALTGKCQIWRHIKVCVACEAEETFASTNCYCASPGATCAAVQARFSVNGVAAGPADLATLYIAWVLGEVSTAIPEPLRRGDPPFLTCNIGVPVDQIDRASRLHGAYERIATRGWRLRGHVRQGIAATGALGWLQSLKATDCSNNGTVALCPETGAAVVAHIANPATREGMYALVDIGAWTTDISFFRLTDVSTFAEGIRTAAFYNADTHRVAAGRIDHTATHLLAQNQTDFGETMAVPSSNDERQLMFRSIRENASAKTLLQPIERRAMSDCLEWARSVTAAAVSGRFDLTRAKAKQKEGPYNHGDWRRLSVFLLGGGSEETRFEEFLKWSNQGVSIGRLPDDARLHVTQSVAARRLQVAAGLAFPIALWPKHFMPSQVERIPATPRKMTARPRLDRDDLYPK
jgi:hypothetical protein